MKKLRAWMLRIGGLFKRQRKDRELNEEIESHLQMHIEDNLRSGMTPEEARRQAMIKLGGIESTKEAYRDQRGLPGLETLWQDLRYGARMLRKNPGFTAVVVMTLALGIGVNAGLFSVVNSVLLNPLSYPQSEQLVALNQSSSNAPIGAISYPNFQDLQKENQTFSGMAISRPSSFNVIAPGEAEQVPGRRCSDNLFSVLGVKPLLGRNFVAGEDEPGAPPVVMISAELWQRKFGASPDVVGKSLTVDDMSYTIVGVLPANFTLYRGTDVYVPLGQWSNSALQNRGAGLGLQSIGRLKPGVTVARAQADLDRVMVNLVASYPEINRGNDAVIAPLKERLIGDVGSILWMLLGAVGFVLLIACVNVSNLLLARSASRTRELAIRGALGAGRWRLLRQLLTESILLALAGGGLGLLLAGWGVRMAISVLPSALPRTDEIQLDARVLVFTIALSLLAGAVAGLAPALKMSRWRLAETLKEGGRGATSGRARTQGLLVATEVALALVLLIGAGLMIRSLSASWNVDRGFHPDNVLTFGLGFPPSMRSATLEAKLASRRQLSESLGSIPGVRAVSLGLGAAPLRRLDAVPFLLEGQPKPVRASEMDAVLFYVVEPGYLTAMGIPLKQGRFFNDRDEARTQRVVVIDEVFASKHFPTLDPIGKRIYLADDKDPREIVGVVGHVKQRGLDSDEEQSPSPQIYQPLRQFGWISEVDVIVRGEAGIHETALLDSIRRVVQRHHSQNVVFGARTLNDVIADSLARQRFTMSLLNAFAVVALLLASIGLYGVISYLVRQRTQELGIRMALGAQRQDILRLIVRQGMKMALSGVAIGLLAAFALTRLLEKMLYGVSPTDLATFTVIVMLLLTVALLASWLPARRAAKVHPMVALRYE